MWGYVPLQLGRAFTGQGLWSPLLTLTSCRPLSLSSDLVLWPLGTQITDTTARTAGVATARAAAVATATAEEGSGSAAVATATVAAATVRAAEAAVDMAMVVIAMVVVVVVVVMSLDEVVGAGEN